MPKSCKYVVEVFYNDDPSDFELDRAVRDCIATLSYKKFKIDYRRSTIAPLQGSLKLAADLVAALREEARQVAVDEVQAHEDEWDHSRDDSALYH